MRITDNMLIGNMTYNLNKTLNRMEMLQYQSSTGKKFRVPSEDPIGASKSLKLRTDMSKIEQYRRNVGDAQSWMKETESALKEFNGITKRAYELTVQAANGINAGEDLDKIKAEISELKDNIIQLANTSYGGRTIFTGHSTDGQLIGKSGEFIVGLEKAFVVDRDGYFLSKEGKFIDKDTGLLIEKDPDNPDFIKNNALNHKNGGIEKLNELISTTNLKKEDLKLKDQIVEYNIGVSEKVEVNTVGNKVFGKAVYKTDEDGNFLDKDDNIINDSELKEKRVLIGADYTSEVEKEDKSYIIALFEELEKNLSEENSKGIQENITQLQKVESNILTVTAEIGARNNRLNLTTEKLENQALNLEELLSGVEDVSIPETYMRLSLEKNVYNASLSVGSQIIQQSLVDFIR